MTTTMTESKSATRALLEWQAAGACRSVDPEIFFPVSAAGASAPQIEHAKRICAGCQVRRECLDFAVQTSETNGIWGGTTPEERVKARRAAAARRRHAGKSWRLADEVSQPRRARAS